VEAVVLAAAGLRRLEVDLKGIHKEVMGPKQMVPAPAQGVLAFQCREVDGEMKGILSKLHDSAVEKCIGTERKILNRLEGGCQQPIGVYCKPSEDGQAGFVLWAAYSAEINQPITRVFLRGKEPASLVDKAVQLLKNQRAKTIFITRDLAKDSPFKNGLSQLGHHVVGESLIEFKSVSFEFPKQMDYLFFSSKRGVRFFFQEKLKHVSLHSLFQNGLKIGAIGAVTASEVEAMGFRCDFVGTSKAVAEVGEEFALVAAGKKIVFPQASMSQRSIQKGLESKNQVGTEMIDLVVYDNIPKNDFTEIDSDILVFTSPLNVQTYLKKKTISKEQTVVAIGPTTAEALETAGYRDYRLPYAFDEVSLADVCY